jgi:hypothetical protein
VINIQNKGVEEFMYSKKQGFVTHIQFNVDILDMREMRRFNNQIKILSWESMNV